MATTELDEPTPDVGPVLIRVERAVEQVTGTDERFPFRVLFLLLLAGLAGASAPMPIALVGVTASVWLAVEVARLAWRKR